MMVRGEDPLWDGRYKKYYVCDSLRRSPWHDVGFCDGEGKCKYRGHSHTDSESTGRKSACAKPGIGLGYVAFKNRGVL